jgi:hypothetical protein
MSAISVKQFIEHIMKSKQFREKYSADVLLDFFNHTHNKKYKVAYNRRIKYLLDEICEDNTTFPKEFYNDLLNELNELKNKKKNEKIIRQGQTNMLRSLDDPYLYIRIGKNYFTNLANKYNIDSDEILVHKRIETIRELWYLMDESERSLWIRPSNQRNPYTKWISIYKNKVLEVYPNTTNTQLYHFMGNIWTYIWKHDLAVCYDELYEYTRFPPYTKFTEKEIKYAHRVNTIIIEHVMKLHRKALETIKKYIHMKRFVKLCKSEEFNKYFWDPKNMGGKWHINKMKKMCSEL